MKLNKRSQEAVGQVRSGVVAKTTALPIAHSTASCYGVLALANKKSVADDTDSVKVSENKKPWHSPGFAFRQRYGVTYNRRPRTFYYSARKRILSRGA
jgi:hypothetical protein